MKINLEVIHSCTIKRKKPWPKILWIGKEKQQLFLLDSQRMSQLDPKNGKTKRKVPKLSSFTKIFVTHNISSNGQYFVAVLNNGDLIVWNKDIDLVSSISGLEEFAFKLGSIHSSSVFISDDSKKIILVTSRNKVFVWEADVNYEVGSIRNIHINGNWFLIEPDNKVIKIVEDNKELVLHARFYYDQFNGLSATCSFAFNFENKLIVNILKINWDFSLPGESKFETIWISHQPQLVDLKPDFASSSDLFLQNKMNCLYTRGAYVIKLSHSTNLLALACNQKYVERNCLIFMSPRNGELFSVNLRNFGLNVGARGRHYWIHDLCWTNNDLYLAGITKHGAVFLVSRLGHPLFIHAIGKEINMGPALYLTLHPLIIVRGKSSTSMSVNGDASLSSTAENEDNLRQRYSIHSHPNLPILICSDGYLVCILKLQTAFATQSRLIRELMHETIGSLNSVSNDINHQVLNDPFEKITEEEEEENYDELVPEWSFKNQENKDSLKQQSEKSGTDSGVDSNEGNKRVENIQNPKISEGKIIFSFLPQILPISMETMKVGSISNRMEKSFEYLQSSWSLLITTSPFSINSNNQDEFDQIAKAIQQAFTQFSHLFLLLDTENLKEFQIYKNEYKSSTNNNNEKEEQFKLKVLVELFIRMLRLLSFDPSSNSNPNSHMIIYCARFVEKFFQSLLKPDNLFQALNRMNLLGLVFNLLNSSEMLIKSIYQFSNNDEHEKFEMNGDFSFNDYILEKSWLNLMHYVKKYRNTLKLMGPIRQNQLEDLDMFVIILQHKMQKFPKPIYLDKFLRYTPIADSRHLIRLNLADIVYLDYGNVNVAIESWKSQLNNLFTQIDFLKESNDIKNDMKLAQLIFKSIKIAHKIFYACISNYELNQLIQFINAYFTDQSNSYSLFILKVEPLFKYLQPPKPLQKAHIAIVSVIKSLARLMSLYLINDKHKKSIFIPTVHSPIMMPNLISYTNCKSNQFPVEILKEKLTCCLNSDTNLLSIFTPDKVLELFISTGLYDEAIYFLNSINDWKSSFLIESILKENNNNVILDFPKEMSCEHVMSFKLCSLLGIGKTDEDSFNSKLMEKSHMDSVGLIIKELLLCAAVTRTNVVESLLNQMMDSLVFHIEKLIHNNGPIVPDDFYLPAPPIYCAQMNGDEHSNNKNHRAEKLESHLRVKLCVLCKCIITLLKSSNLHVALIKWYLEQLKQASQQMNEKYGIQNLFELNYSLNNLLVSIRYQKLGYITDNIMLIFRDFCCLIFYTDLRDRFTLSIRQYRRLLMLQHSNEYSSDFIQTCLNIIDFGNLMLSYRLFLRPENHIEIQDIILSTISKLTNLSNQNNGMNLEKRLALCVNKKPFSDFSNLNENFEIKLKRLLETWQQISSSSSVNVSMYNVYESHVLPNMSASNSKLAAFYGIGEDSLSRVYFQKLPRLEPQNCGGYDSERTQWSSDFLDLFFKLGFDQTEDWDSLQQSVNQTPLLPEFYDLIRNELGLNHDFVDKQYLIKPEKFTGFKKAEKREKKSLDDELDLSLNLKRGLFRTYSLQSLNDPKHISDLKLKKAVSFSNLNKNEHNIELRDENVIKNSTQPSSRFEQPYKLIDYGYKYVQISNLAIWLIKWANRFQKILLENNKTSQSFWYLTQHGESNQQTTLKITCLNANFLVASVYLANGNHLDASSKNLAKMIIKPKLRKAKTIDQEEDLTQISTSPSPSLPKIQNQTKITEEALSSSSTLDISSLTENQVKKIFKPKDQKEGLTDRSYSLVTPIRQSKSPVKQLSFSLNKSKDETNNNKNANRSLSSTLEASEFYNLNNIRPLSEHQSIDMSSQNQSINDTNKTTTNKIENDENEDLNKTKKSGTFEFITSFFGRSRKNSSQSPNNRSKSPVKTVSQPPIHPPPPSQSPRHEVQKEAKIFNNNNSNNNSMQLGASLSNQNKEPDVHEIIRNELKKIVQMQHDTVMNFLNGGSNANTNNQNTYRMSQNLGTSNSNNNLDQQLVSILKQNQFQANNNMNKPIEFVIETKIKTIDPKTGQPSNNPVSSMISSLPNSYNNTDAQFENRESHFMKTFIENDQHFSRALQQQQKTSSLIKIPLLNMNNSDRSSNRNYNQNYETRYLPQIIEQKQSEFKLLDFKSQQSLVKIHHQSSAVSNDQNQYLNKHIKEYIEKNAKKADSKFSNYPLLKLNKNDQNDLKLNESTTALIETQENLRQTIQSNQSILLETNRSNTIKSIISNQQQLSVVNEQAETKLAEKETKEIQVSKPMYDGYVIAPDAFKDMLSNNDKQNFDSAQAHFNATEHLRRKSIQVETNINKNKRDTTTMTDNLENVFPIPPDILFKLKFDSKRMNREKLGKNDELDDICKDYVNVVDLDEDAVGDILKLIEHEQNKRQGRYVSISPRKQEPEVKQLEEVEVIQEKIDAEKTNRSIKVSDSLTEKILQNISKTEDEYKEYDQIMQSQIEEATKQAGQSIAKKRMLNEIKYIDEKIRLMNEMTSEMSSDYAKYNKIADTIHELSKQREIIQKCQQKQDDEDEKLRLELKNKMAKNADKIKFYEKKQTDDQINDLKKHVSSSKKMLLKSNKHFTQQNEKLKKSLDIDDDDELSDLKEDEEIKLKKILSREEANNTANSISNLLNDVFEDVKAEKLDEIFERKTPKNPINLPAKKTGSKSPSLRKSIKTNNNLGPSKSPLMNKKQVSPTKLNRTFEKQQVVSPIVKIEKEKLEKRQIQNKQFIEQRTEDAKLLLEDMLVENEEFASSIQKQQQLSAWSPSTSRKFLNSSKSPINRNRTSFKSNTNLATIDSPVPLLNLNLDSSKPDLETAKMSMKNKKPSLMARTIMQLKRKEDDKQLETENLLFLLEQRAKAITDNQKEPKPIKTIKSFTEMVKLQKPNKLRDRPGHKPMTYTQQLMNHQETTIVPSKTNKNDMFKLYGSKRVKGFYDGYVKEGPRKPRPYSERLKDLKPKESQAKIIVRPMSKLSSNSSKNVRHNLQKKTKANILNQHSIKNRFKPYDSIDLNEKIEDLSSWSLDDKMKRIIYDNGENNIIKKRTNNAKIKNKSQKHDCDQDTLADMDPDYMLEDLLEDEKENERMYENVLKSLNEIENVNYQNDEEDYINKVDLEDLENMSLSSGSAQLTSYIDWDQIDNLIQNFK